MTYEFVGLYLLVLVIIWAFFHAASKGIDYLFERMMYAHNHFKLTEEFRNDFQ